jgi:hypothetical protein
MGIDVFKLSCKEFFVGHFKSEDSFCSSKIFQKNRFFGQFFKILQVVPNPVLAKPYKELEG